ILRALVACGWFGIQTWIGGEAINAMIVALAPSWARFSSGPAICFVFFWLLNVLVILRGIETIRFLQCISAPFLLLIVLALLRRYCRHLRHDEHFWPGALGSRRRSLSPRQSFRRRSGDDRLADGHSQRQRRSQRCLFGQRFFQSVSTPHQFSHRRPHHLRHGH